MFQKKPIIGAHVSTAGGLPNAIDRAVKIGAQAIQIHATSPRQWEGRRPTPKEIAEFKNNQKKTGIGPIFLHAQYLVNFASSSKEVRINSAKAMILQMELAYKIGAKGVVFHLGSGGEALSKTQATRYLVLGMKNIIKRTKGRGWLIMENSSGGGGKLGVTTEEIAKIKEAVGSSRVKICLDIAHAYGAGILGDVTSQDIKEFMKKFDKLIGFSHLVMLHANDSKAERGSGKDRHENIGEGYIGIRGFRVLAKEKAFLQVPWILETPGFGKEGPDRKNIKILKSLLYKH